MRVLLALILCGAALFSVFGFLATLEPPGWPVLRVLYALGFLLCLGGLAATLRGILR